MQTSMSTTMTAVSDTLEADAARGVFELADDLLGCIGDDGHFTALNPAWERTLGFTRQELMAQPWIEFVHPSEREASLAVSAASATACARATGVQNRLARKSGGWCWLSWQYASREACTYFIARDVTGRVAEDQRRHLLSSIVEGVDDAILTKTTDGVVTSWNHAAEELYGYTAAEAMGQAMVDLVVPKDRCDEPAMIVERLLGGGGVRQYTTQRCHKDGTAVNVSLTASLLRDSEYRVLGVAVVTRDIAGIDSETLGAASEIDALVWVGGSGRPSTSSASSSTPNDRQPDGCTSVLRAAVPDLGP